MDTLTGLSREKEYDISNYRDVALDKDDIAKYKNIAFKSKSDKIYYFFNFLNMQIPNLIQRAYPMKKS